MKLIKRLLTQTQGYTLVELLISITIFAIGIVPLYQILVSGAMMQNVAEETYEATLHGQALLQSVKKQIEKDVGEEYRYSRGIPASNIKPWLDPDITSLDPSLTNFLEIEPDNVGREFNEKYNLGDFLYEVHIWTMKNGEPVDKAISFTAYEDPMLIPIFDESNTTDFTRVEIHEMVRKYFVNRESSLWTELGLKKPVGIGEIAYDREEIIKIRAIGIDGENMTIDPIEGYGSLHNNTKLIYESHEEVLDGERVITHEVIIEDGQDKLGIEDIVQLSIDLTTFQSGINSKIIRVENRTKATVVIPVYNEKNLAGIKMYPIQTNEQGNIVVETRPKLEPSKNFIIGIIVKDANNVGFGEKNKVLSKIVDVYSYDYNKQ